MNFIEIEFKYDASDIKLSSFISLVEKLLPQKRMMVSSHDDYFVNENKDFLRYRYHDTFGELTIKRKTSPNSNINRIEVNLPTDGNQKHNAAKMAEGLGYTHNFSVFKTCYIYWLDNVVLSYYVVFDENIEEKRRFIEIEADESYPWSSPEEALTHVIKYESLLEPLGIDYKRRLKKSLFELFVKDSPKS